MINTVQEKKFDIVLPNTNKALHTVLQNLSSKDLTQLSQNKDLGSIMQDLLRHTQQNSSSNQELLELIKNNPTLKNLSDTSGTIKDLLNSLQSLQNNSPLEKVLTGFLQDLKTLKNDQLLPKFLQSGIFLESQLKNSLETSAQLTQELQKLKDIFSESKIKGLDQLHKEITQIINSLSKQNISNSSDLQALQKIINIIQNKFARADSINSQQLLSQLSKIEHLIEPSMLQKSNFDIKLFQNSLKEIFTLANKSLLSESKTILDLLQKIFSLMKQVDTTNSQSTFESFISKKIPQEIDKLINSLSGLQIKNDPLLQLKTQQLIQNIQTSLNATTTIKDISSNDLKALLLQNIEQLQTNPQANQDQLKLSEKLLLQIDHYQLLSHLSNNSVLFLPYSWDMLEDGKIHVGKNKEDRFYCNIELTLKEFGELLIKLTLFEKNQLNIQLYTHNKEFQKLFKNNLQNLRSKLIDLKLTPREIRIFNLNSDKQNSPYFSQKDDIKMGFEVKA
jgi:hypothetical protein